MKKFKPAVVSMAVIAGLYSGTARAERKEDVQAQQEVVSPIVAGERLSAYLRRNQLLPGVSTASAPYLPGMVLLKSDLKNQRQLTRTQLLTDLYVHLDGLQTPYAALVNALAAKERLILKSTDADYLQLRPNLDPVLQPDDSLLVGQRPETLLVVGDFGSCSVPYKAGFTLPSYLSSCLPKKGLLDFKSAVDEVWLVQPTGEIHRVKVANWNAGKSVAPMPGAWIIAPSRKLLEQEQVFDQLAAFLATQGPSSTYFANAVGAVPDPDKVVRSRDLPVTASDFGSVGLFQTPTARMREAGTASVTLSRVEPYSRYSIILQPFDWLEGGFRYTKVTNRLYSNNAEFSGDQKYLDKNIDVKFRLLEESAYLPELAVGLNDIGGTALFAGEYLVGSKRFGNWDTSLGLGWGYLGSSGDISNPFGIISDKFDDRTGSQNEIGEFTTGTFFRGRAAVFGGVQWHTPWDNVIVKLEYEGNNYQNEGLLNPQVQDSRFNYGVVYRFSDNISLQMGVERGNTMAFALSFQENLSTLNTPKISDPKPLVVTTGDRPSSVNWDNTLLSVKQQADLDVTKVDRRGSEVRLNVRNGGAAYYPETLDRTAEVLHRDLPEDVKWFTLNYENNGVDVGQHVIDRDQFVKRRTEYQEVVIETPGLARQKAVEPEALPEQVAIEGYDYNYSDVFEKPQERFTSKFGLGYRQVLGGADGFLYALVLANDTRLNLSDSTWLDGRLAYRLTDNFDKFNQPSDSRLPAVRTKMREYAITSDFTIPRLNLLHMGKLADGHYYSAYGGLLEQMFAGVGGEYLYRPHNSRFALGVDVNVVRQRAFEQDFDLQDYRVNTGHVTAYVDTGFQDILATVSVGQYLAGDRGVTVDLSREFNNGVRMGAFASRTNVSAADFGEGSFDKGIYMSVPFSAFFTKSIPGDAMFLWRPLTRDGAAKLSRPLNLYSETEVRNPKTLKYKVGQGD